MIAATRADLTTLAARLIEVFELAEFTALDAADIAEQGDLDRMVSLNLVCEQISLFGERTYTNAIYSDATQD